MTEPLDPAAIMAERLETFQARVLVVLAEAAHHPLPAGHAARRIVELHKAESYQLAAEPEAGPELLTDNDESAGEQPDLWPGLRDVAQAIDGLVAARTDVHCPNFGPHLFSDANVCIRCGHQERP